MRVIGLVGALALFSVSVSSAPLRAEPAQRSATRSTTWIKDFPSPATVNRDITKDGKGGDALDIAARQRGTLYQLFGALSRLSGSMVTDPDDKLLPLYKRPPPAITAKRRAYWDAMEANQAIWYPRLEQQKSLPCDGKPKSQCERARYIGTSTRLQYSRDYAEEVATRYFPPSFRARYVEAATPEYPTAPAPSDTARPSGENAVASLLWRGLVLLFVIGLIFFVIRLFRGSARSVGRTLSDNYGSARFADARREPDPHAPPATGVFLGKSSHDTMKGLEPISLQNAPIFTQPETHTLILARSGTGKGTRVIIPTLLRYADSMIVIDPKGENAAITARVRVKQLDQAVHIINPWNELATEYAKRGFSKPATFNPLDVLDRNDPNAVAIAQTMAAAICGQPNERDGFWRGSAAALLSAVFLWLADQAGEKKTLERARQITTMSRADLETDYLTRMKASSAFRGAISELASPFIGMAEETYSGIHSNLAEATKFISDPQIKESTASSSFAIRDLIDTRMTVFLVFPTDRMSQARTWLRLILAAVTHTFRRTPRRHDSPRCMFVIDEFPALGRLDDMPNDIAVMRGYGLDFTLVVQGIDQLKHHYGEAHQTIINNCQYKWFCNISDPVTAKYLSEACGKKTVGTTTTGTGSGPGGNTSSVNLGETGRDLITPDEVIALGKGTAIVINPGDRPFYLFPIDYWNLTPAFAHLALHSMKAYFTPPLRYDDNPYVKKAGSQQSSQDSGQQDTGAKGQGGQRQQGSEQQQKTPPPRNDGMTRKKALDILGLAEGADEKAIRAAFKRLMGRVHPDTGGTNYFAQQLNEARDYLVGKK